MSIQTISTGQLRCMGDQEGLVLQGCGGDPQEWVDGINEILAQEGILKKGAGFEEAYTFRHDGLTCIAPRVIFATTTPVRPDYENNDNSVILRYNTVIVPKLRALGLEINDLYSLVAPNIDEYIRESDKIHLSEEGARICSEQVVKAIRGEL